MLTIRKCGTRHLVLVDVENMACSASPSALEVHDVEQRLRRVITDLEGCQCIVACSHRSAGAVSFGFRPGLRRWKSGSDGADLALVNEMADLRVMQRFERVTVCSGDGIFTESVAALNALGIDTTVVSVRGGLSRRLGAVAKHVVLVEPPPTSPGGMLLGWAA
jgi:uncharacterized LabA/DUF88 family protein